MKTWLFNPFIYIAGWSSLLIGFAFMISTLIVAYYSGMHFDGAIDAHIGLRSKLPIYIIEQLIAWGSVVTVFFLLAFVLSNSHFRLIDIAGTMALARAPMLLVAIMAFLPPLQNAKPGNVDQTVLAIGLLMLIPLIWTITLMYNAFTTSINLKGTKAVVGFISGLILAEILSFILNQSIHPLLQ